LDEIESQDMSRGVIFVRNEMLAAPSRNRPGSPYGLTTLLLVLGLAASVSAGKSRPVRDEERVVVFPVANMYSSAAENTDVVSQAILGSDGVILAKKLKRARVRTRDQSTGGMSPRDLRKSNAPYSARGHRVQDESLFAYLYRGTDVTEPGQVLTVPFQPHLEMVDDAPDNNPRWLEVRLPDGRMAWIPRSDTVRDSKPLTIEQSIELAKRFPGLPYLWGRRSSYG
jgi:hypothetical protein